MGNIFSQGHINFYRGHILNYSKHFVKKKKNTQRDQYRSYSDVINNNYKI